MLSLYDLQQTALERAINRAVAYEPTIIKMSDVWFRVNSENDNTKWYDVKFTGQYVSCDCLAHTMPTTTPRLCKHVAGVLLVLYTQGRLGRAANPVCLICNEAEAEVGVLCLSCMDAAIVDPAGCTNCGDSEVEEDNDGLCNSCYQLREELRACEIARVREAEIDLFGYSSSN